MADTLDVDFGDDPPEPVLAPVLPMRRVRAPKEPPARDYLNDPILLPTKTNGNGRTLPHSIEAEEHLLSVCMFDGADVVPRAEEAGIRESSFYQAANAIVYQKIRALWAAGKQPDVSLVAEELKSARQLEAVGGISFLVQVSSHLSSVAQAGYFIEKVRQLALQRQIIKTCTGLVEETYELTTDIDDFLEGAQVSMRSLADGSFTAVSEKLACRAYDPTKKLEKPSPIFMLGGTTIATPGNLTALYSQAKTGKSAVVGACLAATMTNPTNGHDTLGISGPNYGKKAVLHFDTEQSPYDWQQLINTALKRVGATTPPEWLQSYNLTGVTARECCVLVEAAIRINKKRFGGIHSVFIDGIADLVVDPNDPDECFPLVTRMHALSIEHDTAIVLVLHMNPGVDTKGRGHLGSQLERKCESNITLEKDGNDITKIFSTKQRGKSIKKDEAPSFRWSDDKGMHVSCPTAISEPKRASNGGGRTTEYSFATFRSVIPRKTDAPIPINELARRCAANAPINIKQMFSIAQRWVVSGELESIESPGHPTRYRTAI